MRRRRHAEESHSQDRWLVSYSDFITLLFAFFVVLFASAHRDNEAIVKLSHAIQNGFKTLGAFPGVVDSSGPSVGIPAGANSLLGPDAQTANALGGNQPHAVDLQALRKELEAAIGPELKDREVTLRVTPEGFIISLKELGFFDSGQAALLPGAADKIKRIANVLARQELDIRVEGHSDNQPIHNAQFRSNWELSTARAMAVLQLFVDDPTFDLSAISVAGYGPFHPVADNATPEGRRMNRRVDLVVLERRALPVRNP